MQPSRRIKQLAVIAALSLYLIMGTAAPAHAMHIMEGFLPVQWAVFWWIVALPFWHGSKEADLG